eukprot:6184472-Pleurochrysis_carterae.AAC.1
MIGLTGAPSGRSGRAVRGGGDGEGSARLARLRVGAREGDASGGGAKRGGEDNVDGAGFCHVRLPRVFCRP